MIFFEHVFPFASAHIHDASLFPNHIYDHELPLPKQNEHVVSDDQHEHEDLTETELKQPLLRRTSRLTRPPTWHEDFIVSNFVSTVHPLSNVFTYANLRNNYRILASTIEKYVDPQTYSEATKDPNWVSAMQDEK